MTYVVRFLKFSHSPLDLLLQDFEGGPFYYSIPAEAGLFLKDQPAIKSIKVDCLG